MHRCPAQAGNPLLALFRGPPTPHRRQHPTLAYRQLSGHSQAEKRTAWGSWECGQPVRMLGSRVWRRLPTDENARRHTSKWAGARRITGKMSVLPFLNRLLTVIRPGYAYAKCRANIGLRSDTDRPTEHLHQTMSDGEPQPNGLAGHGARIPLGCPKWFKHA